MNKNMENEFEKIKDPRTTILPINNRCEIFIQCQIPEKQAGEFYWETLRKKHTFY